MKKKILIVALALANLNLFSQDNSSNANYTTNGFWSNWFLNVGGGGAMYFGSNAKGNHQSDEADLMERLTWGATVSAGKWFSPLIGARLTVQGGAKHTFNEKGAASNPDHKMATGHYMAAHIDGMLNLSNLLAGYKADRFYNLIPYVGVGVGTDDSRGDEFRYGSFVPVAGLLNSFRVSDNFAITLDISGQAVQSKWNDARFDTRKREQPNYGNRQDWDGIGSANLGISFGLGGKQRFEKAGEASIIDNTDNSLIESLNRQVDDLAAENNSLKKQLENARKPGKPDDTKPSINKDIPYPVHFELNKSAIEPSQDLVVYNVAEFLKNNPNTAVKIVGYADKQTGTSSINSALSKRRSQAVEDKLVKEYGISKNRIISSWKGDQEQPYPVNNWNRVVVITVVDK